MKIKGCRRAALIFSPAYSEVMGIVLGKRLSSVAELVLPGARVADIGTDHAYLAVELATRGSSMVIAADKNEGPCSAARRAVSAASMEERVTVRRGDGLSAISNGEVDVICIAGMGGALTSSILDAGRQKLMAVSRLVLQPMNDAAELRRWLYANDWHIVSERLVEEGARLYEIIAAEPGHEKMPEEALLIAGPVLSAERPPLFSKHIKRAIQRMRRAASGMEKSETAGKSKAHDRLVRMINELEAMVK